MEGERWGADGPGDLRWWVTAGLRAAVSDGRQFFGATISGADQLGHVGAEITISRSTTRPDRPVGSDATGVIDSHRRETAPAFVPVEVVDMILVEWQLCSQ
jgi:hypothetical protein